MARTKAVPRKPRSTPMAASSTLITAAALNTRIHRILNASSELKQRTVDSSCAIPAFATQQTFYVNPFAAITQGTGSNQRIGDSIRVEKISVAARWFPNYANANYGHDLDFTWRNVMLKVEDLTLTSSTPASWGVSNLVYGGFPVNGKLNTHDNTIIQDKIFAHKARAVTSGIGIVAGGSGYHVETYNLVKKFPASGYKYDYAIGANVGAKENFVMGICMDLPGYLTANVQGTLFYCYTVEYRDV